MKAELLNVLRENQGMYLSGEKISHMLHVSRTAVWKQIESLRKEGYDIHAVSNKGYQLKEHKDLLSKHSILSRLKDNKLFYDVDFHESVTSTQTIALQRVSEGAKEGVIVVANEQTAGKGRLGRQWYSPKNNAISMSLILKPKVDFRQVPQLTLIMAVAVVRAIKRTAEIELEIKWPNDLLIDGKKVCGILTELQADPDRIQSVIVGVGLNVNQTDFSSNLTYPVTSLKKEVNRSFDRSELIAEIVHEFSWLYDTFHTKGFSIIKPLWEAYSVTIGKVVTARTTSTIVEGLAIGMDDNGVLLVKDNKDKLHRIHSADIEIK